MASFWTQSLDAAITQLKSTKNGLTTAEASQRLGTYGPNSLGKEKSHGALALLLAQFKSPVILILFFATILSFFLRDTVDALIILTIILISGLLGFWQEYGANVATAKLLAIVQIKATTLRDGKTVEIGVEQMVPGDIVQLKAGDIIPADGLIIASNSLFVDESTLTGETYPVEKEAGTLPESTGLSQRKNSLWMGTHVISGTADYAVVHTGKNTEQKLRHRYPMHGQDRYHCSLWPLFTIEKISDANF